jgi:predicted ATPase/DNA-binding CsgD family transcriptional regulator
MLLDAPGIVTVTGPGGVGKTALVDHASAGWDEWSPWLVEPVRVDLSDLSRADMVLGAIAHAIGIAQTTESPLALQVAAALATDAPVVVLDNFEHVVTAAAQIVALARRCPDLRLVVTSRVPLRVRDERVLQLAPLPLPDDAAAATHPALTLFAEVAVGTDPAAVIDGHEQTVASICRRLDGLPLAIELAAARSAVLGPAQIDALLAEGRHLAVLRDGPHDLPDRQRDLEATLAWSYGLLGTLEQQLLAVLSGFAGWFDLDDVGAVAGVVDDDIDVGGWLDALSVLVDAHLVTPEKVGDDRRYRIAVPVREFCERRLRANLVLAEASAIAHRDRAIAVGRTALLDTEGRAADRGFARLGVAAGDLTRAFDAALAAGDAPRAAAVAPALSALGYERGLFAELLPRLHLAVGLLDRASAPLADRAHVRGWLALLDAERRTSADDPARLEKALLEAADMARASGDTDVRLRTLMFVAWAARTVHNFDSATAGAQEGITVAEAADRVAWLGRFEVEAAMVAQKVGDDERAVELARRALHRGREIGDPRTVVRAVGVLRPPGAAGFEPPLGCPTLDEALTMAISANDAVAMRYLYPMAASEAAFRGDWTRAAQRCGDGLREAIESGSTDFGRVDAMVLSGVYLAAGETEVAAELLGVIAEHWPRLRLGIGLVTRQSADQRFSRVEQRADPGAYARAVRRGAAREPRDALMWALEQATRIADGRRTGAGLAAILTARELDVLRLVAGGRSNKEIAVELGITPKTAMHHTSAIYRKLHVRGRTEAAAVAHRQGLLTDV